MSNNDVIYQSKGALIAFLVSEGFQTGSDTGNITGSALDNEIAVWSNPTTIEGDTSFTWDADVVSTLRVSGSVLLGEDSSDTVTLKGVDAGTDNTVLILNGSNVIKTDEIDPKVWAGDLVDYTGTPVDSQVAVWTDTDTLEGDSNLTWNGSTFDIGGALTVDGNTTLGDASGDSVTINAQTIDLANVAAGTDNTVLVYNGSSIVTDEIDSRVWGSTLLDGTNGTNNEIAIFTDSNSVEGDASLTWNGSTFDIGGALTVDGNTTLGDASGDSVTINAQTITLSNVDTGTDNTVLVYDGSSIVTDEIDSKVWAGDLVDYTGTPVNNQVAIWTDTDTLEGDSDLTFDGTVLTMLTSSATIARARLIEYTDGTDAMTVHSDGTIGLARGNVGSPSVQTTVQESDGYDEWTKIMSHGALSNYWAPNVVALVTLNPMGFASAAPGRHFEFIVTARWSRSATGAGAYVAHTDITVEAVNSAAIQGWNPTTDIILTYDGITSAEIWIKGKSNYASCDVTILGGSPLAQPVGSFNPPGWQIEPYQNSTWTTFSSLGTDVYGTWVSKALTGLVVSGSTHLQSAAIDGLVVTGSVVAPNIGTDTDNTVVILNSSGYLKTDEIDSRVWGTTLVDGTNGTNNELAIFTDSNSVEGDADLTFDGTNLSVSANSDAYAEIGRARVGYGGGYSDYAYVSHVDQTSAGQYALLQSNTGQTFVNASTGRAIYFRVNNVNGMTLDSSLDLNLDNNLDVAGTITVTTAGSTIAQNSWRDAAASSLDGYFIFQSYWTNYATSTYASAGAMLDSQGCTHIRGLVKTTSTSAGTSMFRLTSGYWPDKAISFACFCSDGAACRVQVQADGWVTVLAGFTDGVSKWIFLDGIVFDTRA